jgi:hypothetical protein
MRRKVIRLAGAAALTVGALMSGADAQIERVLRRSPNRLKTSRRSKKPPAVLTGAGSAARFITGCAAAGVAGARPAEGVKARGLQTRRLAASPYPVTSSASRPLSGWPYSPLASTKSG